MQDLEQAIRERAYHLWVADGCHEGNADRNWLSAQRDVLAASLRDTGRPVASDAPPDAPAARKKNVIAEKRKTGSKPKSKSKAA